MKSAFLLYENVEPIDLGAIGVISMAQRVIPTLSYFTVAESRDPVMLANGLRVLPDWGFDEAPAFDVLMVPGGPGWRMAAENPQIRQFISSQNKRVTLCSFCTGAMILAACGVLDGLQATTKREVVGAERSPLEELSERFPQIQSSYTLVADSGSIITGGGVTLCIDTVLYLLAKRFGPESVSEVARIMEYSAALEANRSRLPIIRSDR